ncbi:hypothetical protein RB195_007729 [Necator americanus]|uniref:Leucine Rich repeat-containing domain protein n=1 Tax=Necator americanus TaxID=51031 RepID=A0ABR1C110_NECAM
MRLKIRKKRRFLTHDTPIQQYRRATRAENTTDELHFTSLVITLWCLFVLFSSSSYTATRYDGLEQRKEMSSLHDTSTTETACSSNYTTDSDLEMPPCSLNSPDLRQSLYPWATVEVPLETDVDFGSLCKEYGPPLHIHFYDDRCGNLVSRIDFQDVSLTEAVKALNAQHTCTHRINLMIKIDCCTESQISTILPTLKLLLFRCRINFSVREWERCVLQMSDYKFAWKVVQVLGEFVDKIFELNIGSVEFVKQKRRRNNPDEEAQYVAQLLETWLPKCSQNLRCIRIFAFIRLDSHLSIILSKCPVLTHLTLSKISEISCPCFNTIESFEFNGCGMGYTEVDLELGKHLVKYFPCVRVIAYRKVCFDPVLTSMIRGLTPTGQRFKIFQIISVQHFASLVKQMFKLISLKDAADHVELVNERYGTRITVFDSHQIYHSPY